MLQLFCYLMPTYNNIIWLHVIIDLYIIIRNIRTGNVSQIPCIRTSANQQYISSIVCIRQIKDIELVFLSYP